MHQTDNHYDFEKKLNGAQILIIIIGLIALAVLMLLKFSGIIAL